MEYAFRKTLIRFLLVLGVLGLATSMLWAQVGTGELTGLVSDPSGAVIANVTVTLSNASTGDKRTTVTTPAGIYRFSQLPIVGTYTLEVSPKGFKSTKVSGIVVSVGTTISRDIKLELGATTEQVTVEAGAETVQTSESAVSQLVDRRIWQQMPLEVRNQNSFIELVAGAVPQDGSGNNRGAEVNGTRGGAGSYLVEGADNNEQGQAGRGQISPYDKGGAATSISPDAIQEYRVITNSYSAEYGKGGGFITDTVLKSGTNNWHGSAFEYNRIQALTANDWFTDFNGGQDSLVRNQFGGSIGGPIVKDKTFFYGTAELHRVRQTLPSPLVQGTTQQFLDFVNTGGLETWAETSPNGLCVQFTSSPCPGAFANAGTLGPIFSTLRSKLPYPLANIPSSFSPVSKGLYTAGLTYTDTLGNAVPVYGNLVIPDPETFNEAKWTAKFDHRFSDKDQFSAVFLFQDGTFTDSILGGNNAIGPPTIQDGRGQDLGLTWNHTFTPTVLNTFKASYLRHVLNFPAAPNTFGTPAYYTIDGQGVDLGSSPGLPQFFTDNQFQYVDTLSIVHGKHSFKVGGEYRRTRNGSAFFNDAFSSIFPWGVEDTVTDLNFTNDAENFLYGGPVYGAAYLATASVVPSTGAEPDFYRGYRANEFDGFVQDDWRVTNRLTVNLGVRWEYFGPPHNFAPNIDSNFYFGSTVTPTQQLCLNTVPGPQYVSCTSIGVTPNQFFPSSPFLSGVQNGSFQVRNNEIWNKDTNNFGPRVGFAWDMFGNQKLVMRAGAGLMYDRIYNNLFENIRFNPPYFSDNQIGVFINGAPTPIQALQYPLTSARNSVFNNPAFTPVPNPRHIDQNLVTPYYEQIHFGFQYEIAKGYVFEPAYIGTFGHKLTGIADINTYDGRRAVSPSTRTNPLIGADNFRSNGYASNYHALQLSLRKTYSAGLSFSANYTYSHALDTLSDAFNSKNALSVTDSLNPQIDYGSADFDLRHRFVATVSYDVPFMKDNRWIGGWGMNSIISYQSGFPFTPFDSASGYDLNKNGVRSDRFVPLEPVDQTILSGSAKADCIAATGGLCYFDTTQWVPYVCPASVNGGLWCNPPIGRNSIRGPHVANVDFNVTKKFKITEGTALTFQANFFNIFNHPNFLTPTGGTDFNSGTFGQITGTLGDNGGHRITQLALRFDF